MDFTLDVDKEIEKYTKEYKKYLDFTNVLKSTLEKILEAKDLKYDHIESRTKTIDSYREKITRDGKDYRDPLNEVTDLSGIRIVVYLSSIRKD
ncbi:hypothetical protein AGMMS50268_38120 [Spirochaetia bacterium]|nr:hypothetical protein AGMMS50268_38120 [Spirochaetia bacterium]